MTEKELTNKIKESMEELQLSKTEDFKVTKYALSSSNKYKIIYDVIIETKSGKEIEVSGSAKTTKLAIEELAYEIDGNWDAEDGKWF